MKVRKSIYIKKDLYEKFREKHKISIRNLILQIIEKLQKPEKTLQESIVSPEIITFEEAWTKIDEEILLVKFEKALNKAKEGHSSFIIITEKSTGKYVQASVIAGENEIVIDIPEGVLSLEELEKAERFLKDADIKHKATVGLTFWVDDAEKASKIINDGFKEVLNLSDNYEIEIEST
mgnify:CR=1 FL=1